MSRGSKKSKHSENKVEAEKSISENNEEFLEEEINDSSAISEVDIDEFVIRSVKREDQESQKKKNKDVQEMFTMNSKILLTLGEDFLPVIESDVEMPDFTSLTPETAVVNLGKMIGINDHETNLISFWILDTLAGCLKKVQNKAMEINNQKVFVAWYGFFLKTLSIHGWNREETFCDFKNLIFKAMELMQNGTNEIPPPTYCLNLMKTETSRVSAKLSGEISQSSQSRGSKASLSRKRSSMKSLQNDQHNASFSKNGPKTSISKNLKDLELLAECIYDIFANRFKFEVIRTVFTSTTNVSTIFLPHLLHVPKSMAPKEDSKKYKEKKDKKDKKKKELKATPPREEKVIEDVQTNEYIIPLSKAIEVDDKFFAQFFPEELTASSKKSSKGKSKKGK